MKRETALIGALAFVIVASALVLAVVPGAVGDPGEEAPERQGRIHIVEVPIHVDSVSRETATLTVDAKLDHVGPATENVSILFRAIDRDRDVVETERRIDLGTIEGDGEVSAVANLTVDRQGDYRFEVISYAGEERLHSGGKVIEGIGSLPPTYAESAIEFHRFERRGGPLPTISYSVANVSDDDVTLSLGTFLTNGGTEPAGDLTLILLARQADSNVVADRATVHVGQVRPGRTISAEADLTVPEDYNYYLVGLLKRDGVIVDTAQSAANLDPSRTIADPNETTEEVPFNAGDFEESDGESNVGPETTTETGGGSGPGFGVGVALVALLALATLAAGRNRP